MSKELYAFLTKLTIFGILVQGLVGCSSAYAPPMNPAGTIPLEPALPNTTFPLGAEPIPPLLNPFPSDVEADTEFTDPIGQPQTIRDHNKEMQERLDELARELEKTKPKTADFEDPNKLKCPDLPKNSDGFTIAREVQQMGKRVKVTVTATDAAGNVVGKVMANPTGFNVHGRYMQSIYFPDGIGDVNVAINMLQQLLYSPELKNVYWIWFEKISAEKTSLFSSILCRLNPVRDPAGDRLYFPDNEGIFEVPPLAMDINDSAMISFVFSLGE